LYTVLVVASDKERDTLSRLVEGGRYNLLEAADATAALAAVQDYPVDVVVCDHGSLNDPAGELLASIKQQFPTIEVIMLTELPSLETVVHSIKHPAFDYIRKPIDPSLLLDALARAVTRVRSQEDVLQELTQLHDEKAMLAESLKEEQLSFSRLESDFLSFTENSGDLFLRIDAREQLIYVNTACVKLLGANPREQEPADRFFERVVHPADLELLRRGLHNIFHRDSTYETLSLRVRTPDQSTRWVQLSITAISVAEQFLGASCTIQDRTDSYIAQYNLKQSNRNLRVLRKFDDLFNRFQNSDNLEEAVLEGLVREFNLTAALMFAPHARGLQLVKGGGRDGGLADGAVLEPDERLEQLVDSNQPVQVATWEPADYAQYPWASLGAGSPLQVGLLHCSLNEGLHRYILLLDAGRDFATIANLNLLRIITANLARSIANNLLFRVIREAKSDWEATFDSMPDMIAVVDSACRILVGNRALARFADREPSSLEGISFGNIFWPERDPCYLKLERHVAAGEQLTLESQMTAGERQLLFRVHPNTYSTKSISIITVQDLSDEKQMQARNRELELKLFREERLASIGLLASGIAHNLNGPLMTIMGALELRSVQAPDDKTLELIRRQTEIMKNIIGNLLTKSRREQEMQPTELDLNQLIKEQLEFLNADMRFKHQLQKEVQLDIGFPAIRGLYADFSQVLNAILTNCIEAMATTERKELLIRTEHVRTEHGEEAVLLIQDSGIGMDQKTRESMFDPFFTTKTAQDPTSGEYSGGSGLGMTTVYNILKSYRIPIEVKSTPGSGTSFRLIFPPELQVVAGAVAGAVAGGAAGEVEAEV